MKRTAFISLLVIVSMVLSSCTVLLPIAEDSVVVTVDHVEASEPGDEDPSSMETEPSSSNRTDRIVLAMANEQLMTVGTAILTSGMLNFMLMDGPFTILAPTANAFAELEQATVDSILTDEEQVNAYLETHVISGTYTIEELGEMESVENLAGESLDISYEDDILMISGVRVLAGDVLVPNGIVHVIDGLLLPELEGLGVVDLDQVDTTEAQDVDISELEARDDLESLLMLLQVVDLDLLRSEIGPFTLFAPTDDAFERLAERGDVPLDDISNLSTLLYYHVIPAEVILTQTMPITSFVTLLGQPLTITVEDDGYAIDGANVVEGNVDIGSGIAHVIDDVLIPPEWRSAEEIEGLILIEPEADELDAEEPEADELDVEEPEADELDAEEPEADELETEEAEAVIVTEPAEEPVPFDFAQQIGFFKTVRTMVESGLLDDLENMGPVTIFAPNDQAFNALSQEQLMTLAADPQRQREVIEMHIVPGAILARDLEPGTLETMSGEELTISIDLDQGRVLVNDAEVLWVNMRAGDAVIHIIDQVLFMEEVEEVLEPEDDVVVDEVEVEDETDLDVEDETDLDTEDETDLDVEDETDLDAEDETDLDTEDEIELDTEDDVELDVEAVAEYQDLTAHQVLLTSEHRARTFLALMELASMTNVLTEKAPVTILAPVDAAFDELPDATLLSMIRDRDVLSETIRYHVISGTLTLDELSRVDAVEGIGDRAVPVTIEGDEIMFGQATVIEVIQVANGQVYLLDKVLLYPEFPMTIIGRLNTTRGFSQMARLLEMTGLDETLSREQDITLLAPNDAAFEELTEEEMEALTEDLDALTDWLESHIIPRRLTVTELSMYRSVDTLSGDIIQVRREAGNLLVDGMRVLRRDLLATNGVILTVNTVSLP